MRALFLALFLSLFAATAFATAQASAQGGHLGEEKCLSYNIGYINPPLFTDYPQYGHFNVPGYYIGMPMNYQITLANNCKRTFNNIRVIGVQTYYEGAILPDQVWSESAPYWNGQNQTFFVDSFKAGQNVSFNGTYFSLNGRPGLDKTRLIVMHWAQGNPKALDSFEGRVIIDDSAAGIWCPP